MKKIIPLLFIFFSQISNALECSLTQEVEYCVGTSCAQSANEAITTAFGVSYPNSSNNEYRIDSINQTGTSTTFTNYSVVYENKSLVAINPDVWSDWQSNTRSYTVSSSCTDCEILLLTGTCSDSMCEDGYPVVSAGYDHCDRPDLKECEDNSVVVATAVCPVVYLNQHCNSLETCETWARTQITCDTSGQFTYNYIDPDNMSFSCSTDDSNNNTATTNNTSTDNSQVVARLDTIIDKHTSLGTATNETTHAINVMNTDLKTEINSVEQSINSMSNKLDTAMPTEGDPLPQLNQQFGSTAEEVNAKKTEFIESLNTKKDQVAELFNFDDFSFVGTFPSMNFHILNTTFTVDTEWIDYILAFLGVLVVLFAYYDGLIIVLGG